MLTEGQVESFREDGFLIVRGLLGAAEVETMKARAELISRGEAGHVDPAWLQPSPRWPPARPRPAAAPTP